MKQLQIRIRHTLTTSAMVFLLSGSFAFANGAPPPIPPSASVAKVANITNLSRIVVYGMRIPVPVALQVLKHALKLPWSTAQADQDKRVCRFEDIVGSHFQTLRCQTNRQHFRERQRTQMAWFIASATNRNLTQAIENGSIAVAVSNWTNQRPVNPGAIRALLAKLPPANSSYTLRIKNHGRIVSEWVINKGVLVKVWHRGKGHKSRM